MPRRKNLRRKLLIALAVLATAFTTAIPAVGADDQDTPAPEPEKSEFNSYIVVMKADPLLASVEQDELDSGAAQAEAAELEESHDAALEEAGVDPGEIVNDYVNALNGFSATLTYNQAVKVADSSGVALVLPDELHQKTTNSSPRFLGLTDRGGAYASGYDGEGVVVGIIDTGIWPEHPSFADDGSYPAPPTGSLPCEFGNTAHVVDPPLNDAPFTCNNKLIGANQVLDTYRAVIGAEPYEYDSARDDDGHGTHTASTAAGNAGVDASIFGIDRGTISGIAPRAHVIAYKGLGALGGFTSDLAAAIDQAVADGVDVINYSIGGGAGPISADDLAFLFAADAGVFVATSAGNSGPGAETVGSPATIPWITAVGASEQNKTYQALVKTGDSTKWKSRWSHWNEKDKGIYKGGSITPGTEGQFPFVDAADHGNELCDPNVTFTPAITGAVVLCLRGGVARVEKSQAVFEQGGVGMVLYNNNDVQALVTDNHFVPSVLVTNSDGLELKAYIAEKGDDATVELTAGKQIRQRGNKMADFSSRGPNFYPDLVKPDVTAPGVNILAGNTPTPILGSPGELFQSISGTSMSSPHVAGLFALLKQAHPDWSAAMAKSALMTSARQDVRKEDGKTKANPFDFGAGHVDPSGKTTTLGSMFNPGLVYDAGLFEYAAFTCGADLQVFTPGSCDFLASLGIPFESYNLNVPSIGVSAVPGVKTITRTVTNIASKTTTYRADVDEPRGYDVEVSPRKLTLAPGESATFEVTFTNERAPIGAWRFGALTWESGKAEVRSPIAVKASQVEIPGEVGGSGESGSVSIPVSFGYTGAYTASAHGLVPATVTHDNVLQDTPITNPTFDPADVAAGGANAHTFDLTGAAFFRMAMPPEATEADADLDIYVYDPSNTLVATSTAGGTDEEINIHDPAPGIWTVYVHGWAAPGGDSDYDMFTWIISATPGGTLTIDNAPGSATSGTVGSVDLSWTGATAGDWHLGAVIHGDGSAELGRTLVEVDNR
jgi:subtilisin family serine protease